MIKQGVQYRVIHHLFQVSKLSIECNETKQKKDYAILFYYNVFCKIFQKYKYLYQTCL